MIKCQVILIVAHGNLIKGILANKLKLPHSKMNLLSYHNCNVSLLRFKGTKLDFVYYFNNGALPKLKSTKP